MSLAPISMAIIVRCTVGLAACVILTRELNSWWAFRARRRVAGVCSVVVIVPVIPRSRIVARETKAGSRLARGQN